MLALMVQRMTPEASVDAAEMLAFEVREIEILQAWTTKSTVGWMIQPFHEAAASVE